MVKTKTERIASPAFHHAAPADFAARGLVQGFFNTLAGAQPQPDKTCGALDEQITIRHGDRTPHDKPAKPALAALIRERTRDPKRSRDGQIRREKFALVGRRGPYPASCDL